MKTTKFLQSGGEPPAEPERTPAPARPARRRPRRITLWVTVPCAERRTTERAAKSLAEGGLEEVLAAFVSDWAVAEERPGSWEAERINAWLDSHVWEKRERGREQEARKGGA